MNDVDLFEKLTSHDDISHIFNFSRRFMNRLFFINQTSQQSIMDNIRSMVEDR